ncbi:prolyl oligopeptidase [Lasallia pustulata]|uniref:Prolyl oligopeptidase n=1 Tax=Lasallia pustulata TaxID=136370 RepID=A0A1W5D2Y0_9LECA|nr:prolyl oligopeptidase [Lasallia pustulata]
MTVWIWDAATGATLQTLEGHSGPVNAVAFSPDGKQLVSGSHDETVRIWDAAMGVKLQTLEGHSGPVYAVAFSPDGKQLASGSFDKTVWIWDAATGATLQTFEGHLEPVSAVAFSPNGKQLASGSGDMTVRIWDAATEATLQTLEGHSGTVNAVAFSPDNTPDTANGGEGAAAEAGNSNDTDDDVEAATAHNQEVIDRQQQQIRREYLDEINQSRELMPEQFPTEWDFIVWAATYLEKTAMSGWRRQKEQHDRAWVTYDNYLKVLEQNLSPGKDTDEQNIVTFNTAEPNVNDTITSWYKKLYELYRFLPDTYKQMGKAPIQDRWRAQLPHHVLTELRPWDPRQVAQQPVHKISAQLDAIVDSKPFRSRSNNKKDRQPKAGTTKKSTTRTSYYDKPDSTTEVFRHPTSYHGREFRQGSQRGGGQDQGRNPNYLPVAEKTSTTSVQSFAGPPRKKGDFVPKDELDARKAAGLCIKSYDTAGQPYCYKSRFLVSRNDAPAPFVLGLPFLVHVNPNHEYNTGKFLWRKGKHTKANRMFTPSERKALKGVVNMSNLSITDHFIGPADLVTNMENYAVHMNSLCYDKKDDNVYNALPPKYHDFADIFQAAEKQSLPERGPHDHAIDLEPGQQPPFRKLYSMSPAELNVLKVYLDNAVKAGIIRKLISPAASPVMFVPKLDGSLRLVIDYRRLNNITIKNCYPLPLILDMLDRLQGAKKFTKLDCKDAYN